MNIYRYGLLVSILSMVIRIDASEINDEHRNPAPLPPVFANVSNVKELLDAVSRLDEKGGTIILAPGTYEIENTITIKNSNVYIVGNGWNTIIKKLGDGDAIVFSGSLYCCGVRNLAIEGNPNASNGSGIVFRDGEWSGICTIDYCYIRFFRESGIKFDGNKDKPFSSNTVSNCWLQGNLGDQLCSINNNDFYFYANQLGCGPDGKFPRSGAMLSRSSAGTYTMNYHWGNIVGLRVGPGANFNRFENNRIENSRQSGVIIGSSTPDTWNMFNIFTGNTIHTNSEEKSGGYSAFIAYDTHETTFTSNQFLSWASDQIKQKNCLELERCKDWIIKDNIFRHYTGKAVVYSKKDGHIVKDNLSDNPIRPTESVKNKEEQHE